MVHKFQNHRRTTIGNIQPDRVVNIQLTTAIVNHVLKVAQQTRLAGAPTINRLLGITHHQQTAHAVGVVGGGNFLRQWSQSLPLANAGVLKLVKQQMVNARVKSKRDLWNIGVVHGARQLARDGFKGDLFILGHHALPLFVNQ